MIEKDERADHASTRKGQQSSDLKIAQVATPGIDYLLDHVPSLPPRERVRLDVPVIKAHGAIKRLAKMPFIRILLLRSEGDGSVYCLQILAIYESLSVTILTWIEQISHKPLHKKSR